MRNSIIYLKRIRLTGRISEVRISADDVLQHEFYKGRDACDHYAKGAFDLGPIFFL